MNEIDISIVLAVYNEEHSILEELKIIKEAMKASKFSYEIIVIDDASTDRTPSLLSKIDGIRLITHRCNQGSGGSRKTGTINARGKIVVWTDADLTYPNNLIPELVHELYRQEVRQIVGARKSEKGTMRILRAPAKFFLRKLASYLSKTKIPDLNSGFRAFFRDDALKFMYLIPNGFSCVSTITLAFLCNNLSVGFMPIEYKSRIGKSKFHPIKDTYAYFLQIIRMITYFEPLRIFMPLSVAIFSITIIKHVFDLVFTKNTQETDVIGYFVAIIIFAVGLLADLIVVTNKKINFTQNEE